MSRLALNVFTPSGKTCSRVVATDLTETISGYERTSGTHALILKLLLDRWNCQGKSATRRQSLDPRKPPSRSALLVILILLGCCCSRVRRKTARRKTKDEK